MPTKAKDVGPAEWLAALGEPTRLFMLGILATDQRTVTQLATACRIEMVNVSHHLKKLRIAGLVAHEKDGRHVIYRLVGAKTSGLMLELSHPSGVKVSIPLA
jgi:ArsR family transcriptional regulator